MSDAPPLFTCLNPLAAGDSPLADIVSPFSEDTAASSTPPSRYASVLWNGKIGTLVLHSQRIVFAGLSGISVSIPWHLVKSHERATETEEVDLRLGLLNDQKVEIQFSESQELSEVEQDIANRLQRFQATQANAAAGLPNPNPDADAPSSTQASSTVTSSQDGTVETVSEEQVDSVLRDLEADMQMADDTLSGRQSITTGADSTGAAVDLESENTSLRQSVNTLLDKVGQLEGQLSQQQHENKNIAKTLANQFEKLKRDISTAWVSQHHNRPAMSAQAKSWVKDGEEMVELVNVNGEANKTDFEVTSIRIGEQQPVGDLTMRNVMEVLVEEPQAEKTHSLPKLGMPALSVPHLPDLPLPHLSEPALFTVPESVATDEGMNLIRRKLNFRKSSVTGQASYAMTLPPDTYSFMMVTPFRSVPFALGLLVNGIQITTFLLMAISIIEQRLYDNPFGIPPNVDAEVKVLQFIAIIIAVVTQDDVMKGLDQFRIRESKTFLQAFPHGSIIKVYASIISRCVQGCLGLVASFLLIITSETIYYLLLNFTALEFVTKLDEAFFVLSSYGFSGKTCEVAAKCVDTTNYYVHTRIYRFRKIFLFLATSLGMIAGWSAVVHKQRNGDYLCSTIQIQFGDDLRPELGTFSGLYDQVKKDTDGFRIDTSRHLAYVDRLSKTAIFAYCQEDGYWTFQYHQEGFQNHKNFSACDNWVVRSKGTDAYDLVQLSGEQWVVRNDLQREIHLDPFLMMCHDCGGSNNVCTGRSDVCSEGICECPDGFYGLQCQFEEPCGRVVMDSLFEGFVGTRPWSQEFNLFKVQGAIVNSYSRPVYLNELEDHTYDLLFFTGRRWAVAYSDHLADFFNGTSAGKEAARENLAEAFASFHAYWGNLTVGFLSEPMDLLTPVDSQSPVGLQWYSAKDKLLGDQSIIQTPDLLRPVEAPLLCAVCSADNPCLYSGTCNSLGRCECKPGSDGALCEQPPLGNGRCDPFLNTPQYDYDGGDCCGSSCVSGNIYECGRSDDKYGYVGYECRSPPEEWNTVGKRPIKGDESAYVGHSVALSQGANFLAVGMPGADKVLLYDRDGSNWVGRGSPLSGPEDSFFGGEVRLASSQYTLWNTPKFQAPYTLAVLSGLEGNSTVHVYHCDTVDANCKRKESFDGIGAFDISDNGKKLALGETSMDVNTKKPIQVHRLKMEEELLAELDLELQASIDILGYQAVEPIYKELPTVLNNTESNLLYSVNYISLSGDGETMAVQTRVDNLDRFEAECQNQLLREEAPDEEDVTPVRPDCMISYVTNSVIGEGNKSTVLFQRKISFWDGTSGSRPVVISADSKVVAYVAWDCRGSLAHVFEYNGQSWEQRPALQVLHDTSCTEDYGERTVSLSLSGDGSTLAVGFRGHVYVYDFNGKKWLVVGDSTPDTAWLGDKEKSSVSLNANDGSTLAIGLPGTDLTSGGLVEVVERTLKRSGCKGKKKETSIHFSLTTDANPKELSWTIFNNDTQETTMSVERGYYQYLYATHVHDICLPTTNCTILTILDTGSIAYQTPGLTRPGRADLFVNNVKVTDGGFLGAAKRVFIGNQCLKCGGGSGIFQMYLQTRESVGWELVDHTGTEIFRRDPPGDASVDQFYNNGTLVPLEKTCESKGYWEDVCINYDTDCYVFYVYLVRHPEADPYYAQTTYFLFYNGVEIHRESVTKDGQTAFHVGNCEEHRRLVLPENDHNMDVEWTSAM